MSLDATLVRPRDPAPALEFTALTKRYGDKRALDSVTFTLHPGSVVALLGPNGAGKTTAIEILMGLRHPTSGDARIRGVSLRSREIHEARRSVGYLPDVPALYEELTGREFLRFIAQLHDRSADWDDPVDRALDRLGLAEHADALVRTCSLGVRKRLAFLAATIGDPEILVLDEPTGAMDAASARVVKDTMAEYRARGRLALFTTHVLEIAETMADRILILADATLRFDGSLAEFRERAGVSPSGSLEEAFLRFTRPAGRSGP